MARILVVDDHTLNRDLLKTILGYSSHEVVEASDGVEALQLVRTQAFDLIISDILMPTMDGVSFVRTIRADPLYDHIQVIFYTATYRLLEARRMADSCGVLKVLAKPCEPEVIIATVDECLGVKTLPLGNLERMTLRLSAILEASMDLDLEREPLALVALFCRQIRAVVTSRFAVLGIGEDPEAPLVHLEMHGLPKEQWISFPDHPAFFRRLMRDGKAQHAPAPGWEAHWGLPAGHPACVSLLAIPVSSPRCTYGWVYLADRVGAETFSEEDEKLAFTLAAHFAVAYENLRLTEERVQQERLAVLGTLVGTVAHDIRNPLMIMSSAAEQLAAEIPDDENHRRLLGMLGRASERITALVNDLLDFGRPRPLQLESVRDHVLLQEAVEACEASAVQKSVQVQLHAGGKASGLILDPNRMHQVLCNILENAIQHSPQDAIVKMASSFNDGVWTCTVEDEGSGMAGEDLSKVFDPFFTKRPGGTGLGLAIAHRIVQQHGGGLFAANRSSGGALFTIRLPLLKDPSGQVRPDRGQGPSFPICQRPSA